MANENLKPCPFCGGVPNIEIIEPHKHSEWLKGVIPELKDCEGEAFIICKCSAAITGKNKAEAIERWNRRAKDVGE